MRNLEKKETEYMRLQRHKIGIDDFEQLTVIGKGAFGEVFFIINIFIVIIYKYCFLLASFFPFFCFIRVNRTS